MRKILIVEDVEYNRDLLVQLLEEEYETLTAADGAAGLEAAARHRPDLILMDLSLPGVDGWEATRRLKARPETESIPVIALTMPCTAMSREPGRAAAMTISRSRSTRTSCTPSWRNSSAAAATPRHAAVDDCGG
jgi:two-component system cell cycle response regulator DivK